MHRLASGAWYALLAAVIVMLFCVRSTADDLHVQFLEGFSQPYRVSKVAAAPTGIVKSLQVDEGTFVTAGDCLLEIDRRIHDKQVDAARLAMVATGELRAAEAQLRSSEQRVAIIRNLSKDGSATPDELLRAENELAMSEANLLTTQEKLALRKAEYERLTLESKGYSVEAPFDGVVVEFLRRKGEYVGAADPNVCVVADISELAVNFLVPRIYRPGFRRGLDVQVHFVESGKYVPGTVEYISPFPNGETNTYKIRVRVDNADGVVNAGERCILEYSNGQTDSNAFPTFKTHFQGAVGYEWLLERPATGLRTDSAATDNASGMNVMSTISTPSPEPASGAVPATVGVFSAQ